MPGLVIKKYRELKNYSQKYVASKMGISQNAYSKIENNLTQLTVHHIKQLSGILGVNMTDLLKDDFEIHKPLFTHHKKDHKEELLIAIDTIREKLKSKHAVKHDSYLVLMSLLSSVDNIVSHIY